MGSSLSINSLITQLAPGFLTPPSRQSQSTIVGSSPESGAAFVRRQGFPVSAEEQAPSVYTRKDAAGPRVNRGAEESVQGRAREQDGDGHGSTPAAENSDVDRTTTSAPADSGKKPNGELLSKAELAVLAELKKADQAVRAHEMAHLAAAGGYARGGASFSYQRGPDGQSYAVGGEVQIDTSKEATPEATIVKMQIIRQAALAPADPSPQDQRVASFATLQISEASKELFSSRSSQEGQPLSPNEPDPGGQTSHDIYQRAGQGISQGDYGSGVPSSKKPFSAYLIPKPSLAGNGSSVVDRVV